MAYLQKLFFAALAAVRREDALADTTLPLAVSMGEPAGIGPDLILRLYARRAELGLPPFIVFGHLEFLASRAARLGLNVKLVARTPAEAAAHFAEALPVVHVDGLVPDKPGDPTSLSGKVVMDIARFRDLFQHSGNETTPALPRFPCLCGRRAGIWPAAPRP